MVYRPLLDYTHDQLKDWLKARGLDWHEDATNTAKLTGKEMHNETNVVTADASFTHRFDSEIRYGGGFNKRAMSQFERGKQGNWLYSYSNTSNVPVVMEYTDYLTCGLVSPTVCFIKATS